MFEGFFGRCDELKAAARLVPAYINMAGFDTDTLSDDTDGGDWLGLGDPVKVAEIKRFNKRDNTFNFLFVTLDAENNIIKNQVKMSVKLINGKILYSCNGEFIETDLSDNALIAVLNMAIKKSAVTEF